MGALGLLLFPNVPREASQFHSPPILAAVPQTAPMSQHDKTMPTRSASRVNTPTPAARTPDSSMTQTATTPAKQAGSTIYVMAGTSAGAPQPQVQQQAQEPQLPQAQPHAAAPSTQSLAPQRVHSERILSSDELDRLIARGERFIEQGDVSAARLVLERAADARDPRAALALGSTYDPNVLNRMGVVGVQPEPEKARAWYEKAAEFGSGEANQRLTALAQLAH